MLTEQYGCPEKGGNQPCGVSIKTSPCALKATPAKKRHEPHSETGATVKACCGIQRFMLDGLGKMGAEPEGKRKTGS